MKYSKQRETIFQIVKNSDKHPTAEMIYQEAKRIIPNISLGTVYRNLNSLYEQGYIKHIIIPNDSDRFDKTLLEHHHLYCLKCNKVFDIPINSLKLLNEIVSNNTGFKVITHNLVFEGYCHECERKEI